LAAAPCYGAAPNPESLVDRFTITPALLSGSHPLASLGLCEARLQDDARWPWIVLVPRRVGAREIEHLAPVDRRRLMEEQIAAGAAARAIGSALGRAVEKLNIAALGNLTPQLHVHVIGRRADDPAWPAPVWGVGEARRYDPTDLESALAAGAAALQGWNFKAAS
jgi:diadenosine tetraphosphate (Ap4A) HIT family hydrolase